MARQTLSQTDAILAILANGRRITLAQLAERVGRKTRRSVSPSSLTVRLSNLRAAGHNIATFRGGSSRARGGATQYALVTN